MQLSILDKWTTTTTTYRLAEPIDTVAANGQSPIRNVTAISVTTTEADDENSRDIKVQGVAKGNRNAYWHIVSLREDERILVALGLKNPPNVIDTEYTCPGCGQTITAVRPESGEWFTECGGEGNGGCTVWIDGDPVAEAAHKAVINKLTEEN